MIQAETRKQTEGVPEAYPAIPDTSLTIAQAAVIWQRLETYMAYRYGAREVVWLVHGPGDWEPPLAPATITKLERWDSEYVEVTPIVLGPDGYRLRDATRYRVTATVGTDDVPECVAEAFRRLARYWAADPGKPGATTESYNIGGDLQTTISRRADHVGRALVNCGAADLLRNFRRA